MKRFLQKLEHVKTEDYIHIFKLLLMLPISWIYRLYRKNLWLVCENKMEARDNGYWFFKYVCENHPEQDVVYCIDKKSVDYPKVAKLGKVIQHGSLLHWLYYLSASRNISSHKNGNPNAAVCYLFEMYLKMNNHRVFLQHGVIMNDLEWLYFENTHFMQFMTSAKPEYHFIKDTFGYPDGAIKYTGLCRFDNLHANNINDKQILVMPTWREWISEPSKRFEHLDDLSSFLNTEYYQKWNGFLTNPRLIKLLQDYDLTLIFYPHREMQKYLAHFKTLSDRITVADWKKYDIQMLLKESALMITDYSSVSLDFAYMKKSLIYYQFDYEKFRYAQYGEGYFSYEEDGFGPVAYTEEELFESLISAINNKFISENRFIVRHSNFFELYDQSNCSRTYLAIKGEKE